MLAKKTLFKKNLVVKSNILYQINLKAFNREIKSIYIIIITF